MCTLHAQQRVKAPHQIAIQCSNTIPPVLYYKQSHI
eukprot:UN10491